MQIPGRCFAATGTIDYQRMRAGLRSPGTPVEIPQEAQPIPTAEQELHRLLAPMTIGYQSHSMEIDGLPQHWVIGEPNGPPLVLIHGDYGSWRHWARNLPFLRERYHVLVADMPGYGASAASSEQFDQTDIARRLLAGLSEMGVDSEIRIGGFSLGGFVAGEMAAQAGDAVSHLVLSGPAGLGTTADRPRPRLERYDSGAPLGEQMDMQKRNLAKVMLTPRSEVDDLAALIQIYHLAGPRADASNAVESTALLNVLPRIKAQVSGIWGGEDGFCGIPAVAAAERVLRANCRNFRSFTAMKSVGHWAPFDATDEFNRLFHAALL